MPKKIERKPYYLPSVEARMLAWGKCVRVQRVAQKLTAQAFSERIGISESTLRRVERGDPVVAAGTYLSALAALSVLDPAVPMPEPHLTQGDPHARAKSQVDDGYF